MTTPPGAPPLASVFTPSFNKGQYVADAIRSVLAQDCADFEYWILENSTDRVTREVIAPLLGDPRIIYEEIDLDPDERAACYPTAMLLNRYYAKAGGRYIFYLSDDDLLEPGCVRRCCEFLEADLARQVCYFSLRVDSVPGGPERWIRADAPLGAGTDCPVVDCRIDGGQIAHRRDCLDRVGRPWFPETPVTDQARHADGLFMQKLAACYTFWPLPEHLATHRRTPLSTWDRA